MWGTALLTAIRNLKRDLGSAAINILGFSLAIACCIMILLQVFSELQFDRFHEKSDRLYRVLYEQGGPRGHQTFAGTMPPLAGALKQDFPAVEASTQFIRGWRLTVKRESSTISGIIARNYYFSGEETFSMFDFPFRYGEPTTSLREPGSVVLSSKTARQLFGDRDPVGEQLYIEAEDLPDFGTFPYTVTGVLEKVPPTSHIRFDFLISKSTLQRFTWAKGWMTDWDNYMAYTYVLLDKKISAPTVASQLADFTDKHVPHEEGYSKGFTLQPLTDVHFGSAHVRSEMNANEGDIIYVRLFSLLALFVAAIACVNYVNLSTARAIKRAREIAVRKVIGAGRGQIARQFLGEAVVHSCMAFVIAIGLVQMAIPSFNELAGTDISFGTAFSPGFVASLAALAVGMGLVAGLYPASVLSRTTPNMILRGEAVSGRGGSGIRNTLVVLQFVVTIVMIVATLVVVRQLNFVTSKQLGFNKEHLIVFDINSDDVQENFRTVKAELEKSSLVQSVTVSSRVPGDWKGFRHVDAAPVADPDGQAVRVAFDAVDEDFLATYEIGIAQGRNLSREMASDSNAILLNQAAATALFRDSPIGKQIRFSNSEFVGVVVGVVNDFHVASLHDAIEPMVLGYIPDGGRHALHGIDYFTVRGGDGNLQALVRYVTAVHEKFDHINPIELGFLDDWWAGLYERDVRLGRVFGIAAGLAIVIACIGLLGLASFMATQRTKEIGVRKVLGATTGGLVALLSADFAKLVVVGFVIACPLAYYAMNLWLSSFTYRIDIGWLVFVIAGGVAFGLACLTVSLQAMKAAHANPVKSLRYE